MIIKHHRDSGAFEFFPDPTEKSVIEIKQENKELKKELSEIKSLLQTLVSSPVVENSSDASRLESLTTDQLKEVCSLLGIRTTATKPSTLISKITNSGKSSSDIDNVIDQID